RTTRARAVAYRGRRRYPARRRSVPRAARTGRASAPTTRLPPGTAHSTDAHPGPWRGATSAETGDDRAGFVEGFWKAQIDRLAARAHPHEQAVLDLVFDIADGQRADAERVLAHRAREP